MPVKVKTQTAGYTLVYCAGVVTIDDITKANEIIYSELEPEFRRYQILDASDVTESDLPSEGLEQLASQDVKAAQSLESITIAVVAPVT